MRYIAAGLAAIITFFVLGCAWAWIDIIAWGQMDWGAFDPIPRLTLWSGGVSFVSAVAIFCGILEWRRRADIARWRRTLAARARA